MIAQTMDIAHADTIAGLVKGLAVLESFDTERQRLNATQAAERAGLTRAAARRHLLTLAHVGYLETDGSFFWLSARTLRLAGRSLPRLTPRTTTELRSFKALLAQAAAQDFCIANDEHELGVHAIAVPLRDVRGRTVAALNVIVPPGRLDDASLRADALERLRAAASELRQML